MQITWIAFFIGGVLQEWVIKGLQVDPSLVTVCVSLAWAIQLCLPWNIDRTSKSPIVHGLVVASFFWASLWTIKLQSYHFVILAQLCATLFSPVGCHLGQRHTLAAAGLSAILCVVIYLGIIGTQTGLYSAAHALAYLLAAYALLAADEYLSTAPAPESLLYPPSKRIGTFVAVVCFAVGLIGQHAMTGQAIAKFDLQTVAATLLFSCFFITAWTVRHDVANETISRAQIASILFNLAFFQQLREVQAGWLLFFGVSTAAVQLYVLSAHQPDVTVFGPVDQESLHPAEKSEVGKDNTFGVSKHWLASDPTSAGNTLARALLLFATSITATISIIGATHLIPEQSVSMHRFQSHPITNHSGPKWSQDLAMALNPHCPDLSVTNRYEKDIPLTALATFPRSGNTWVRSLIEKSTGYRTHTNFCDKTWADTFLDDCYTNGKFLEKTHVPYLFGSGWDHYQKVVRLTRNPLDSIFSLFHLERSMLDKSAAWASESGEAVKELGDFVDHTYRADLGHKLGAIPAERERLMWAAKNWVTFNEYWDGAAIPQYQIRYEDMQKQPMAFLMGIISFFVPVEDQPSLDRLTCALADDVLQPYKASAKKPFYSWDQYDDEARNEILEIVRKDFCRLLYDALAFENGLSLPFNCSQATIPTVP